MLDSGFSLVRLITPLYNYGFYMYGRWLSVGAKTWGRYVPRGMRKWIFVSSNGSVGLLDW